jgi:hypothetical protein
LKPDVLVISAHGKFDRRRNIAGLAIRNEFCIGPELGRMPPLVVLSACEVAPRGTGAVNVAELLLREGALAVLGTQVPVNAAHNGVLIGRFFVYITETLAGWAEHRTIGDIWHRTAAGNAVNDVLNGNRRLRDWALAKREGPTRLDDFMMRRSSGHLGLGHIYRDTEAVLQDMAEEDGIGRQFSEWLQNQSYVPESLFYSLFGWPERIVVRDATIAELRSSATS